jgi:ribonuclease G
MKILVAASPGEWRVAAWGGAGLEDYALWRPGAPDGVGDLHRGRVIARVPAMAGAFVAIAGAEGFLPDSEGAASEGSVLGVLVTRAAQGGKGPRLSARLSEAESGLVGAGAPALLRRGRNAVELLAAWHEAAPVWVDDPAVVALLRPALGARVSVGAAFDEAVESAVAALGETEVALPGGARMSVHPTPALTAIDVDLAGATADRRRKATAQTAANRALLPALAQQIRLRNLGGAILVDLGGLSARRRAALGGAVAAALAADPLQPRFLGFTALGLAEILRPRIHPPLHELLAGPHAAGLAALRHAARQIAAQPGRAVSLRAAPCVVAALQADRAALADFSRRAGYKVGLRVDRALSPLGWELEEVARG